MISLSFIAAATVIAVVAADPVAPWWAGPIYVQAFTHIVETLGSASIVAIVSASVQIYYGRDARKDRKAKRLESHVEHGKGLEAAKTERAELAAGLKVDQAVLAAKVEAAAQHMADKVEGTTATIVGKIDANTAVTNEAKDGALRAYSEANSVNVKIAETNDRITEAINAGRAAASLPDQK